MEWSDLTGQAKHSQCVLMLTFGRIENINLTFLPFSVARWVGLHFVVIALRALLPAPHPSWWAVSKQEWQHSYTFLLCCWLLEKAFNLLLHCYSCQKWHKSSFVNFENKAGISNFIASWILSESLMLSSSSVHSQFWLVAIFVWVK